MPPRPAVVAFDVIGTLFPLEPLRAPLIALGLPPHALELWFARTLRDGFALAASGSFRPFAEVAAGTLAGLLTQHDRPPDDDAIAGVLARFADLTARPDAAAAMARLRDGGLKVMAVTNGGTRPTRSLLEKSGLAEFVAEVVTIEEVGTWKPDARVYRAAADRAGVAPDRLGLIAAHAWDCHGAKQAGLVTGWLSLDERVYNPAFRPADATADTLAMLADALLRLPETGRNS